MGKVTLTFRNPLKFSSSKKDEQKAAQETAKNAEQAKTAAITQKKTTQQNTLNKYDTNADTLEQDLFEADGRTANLGFRWQNTMNQLKAVSPKDVVKRRQLGQQAIQLEDEYNAAFNHQSKLVERSGKLRAEKHVMKDFIQFEEMKDLRKEMGINEDKLWGQKQAQKRWDDGISNVLAADSDVVSNRNSRLDSLLAGIDNEAGENEGEEEPENLQA